MEWKKLSTLQKMWIVVASIAAVLLVVCLRDKETLLSSIIAVLTLSEAVLYWNERRKMGDRIGYLKFIIPCRMLDPLRFLHHAFRKIKTSHRAAEK